MSTKNEREFARDKIRQEAIISLKGAESRGERFYSLDKTRSTYHESLDDFRLALCCMKRRP